MEILSAILDRKTRKPIAVPVEAFPVDGGLWVHQTALKQFPDELFGELDFWLVSDICGYAVMQGFDSRKDAESAAIKFLEAVPYWSQVAPILRVNLPLRYTAKFPFPIISSIARDIQAEFIPDDSDEDEFYSDWDEDEESEGGAA